SYPSVGSKLCEATVEYSGTVSARQCASHLGCRAATIHRMIANPIYGGAYAYGKSRSVPGHDGRSGIRRKARDEWLALIPDAHEGYVSWERAEEIRKMVSDNVPTSRHHGAPKHGDALLAGLFRCKRCGRKLTVRYTGSNHNIPRYSCWRGLLDNGEPRCVAFGWPAGR
ncbi:hypothetical protein GOC98_33425, partial [Sinorhizobium medicae]|nr:hypothetical protein [Sinorhizobium medicae]